MRCNIYIHHMIYFIDISDCVHCCTFCICRLFFYPSTSKLIKILEFKIQYDGIHSLTEKITAPYLVTSKCDVRKDWNVNTNAVFMFIHLCTYELFDKWLLSCHRKLLHNAFYRIDLTWIGLDHLSSNDIMDMELCLWPVLQLR